MLILKPETKSKQTWKILKTTLDNKAWGTLWNHFKNNIIKQESKLKCENVLATFISSGYKLESSERRVPQLRKCLHVTGL